MRANPVFAGLVAVPILAAHPVAGPAAAQNAVAYRIVPEESRELIHVGTAGRFGFLCHEHEDAALAVTGTVGVDEAVPARSPVNVEFQATALDRGFRLLYELRFDDARKLFLDWQREHPSDPMGDTAEAAAYLFEEFSRHGVLTSEFFLDDNRLLGGIAGRPDERRKSAFLAASERARASGRRALASRADDANALLAMTLTTGMLSNHASLIEKRQFESLRLVREAEGYGKRLLVVSPDTADGYVALGASRYIIGCLPAYKRVLLWFGGVTGDREKGMEQLAIAAARGRYLRPYAKAMLFLASLREGQTSRARTLIEELTSEFPANPLFAHERAKLDGNRGAPRL